MTKRPKKLTRKRAGKAPGWLVAIAAPNHGTDKQRVRHEMAGFLSGQRKSPVRRYSAEEIAAYVNEAAQ